MSEENVFTCPKCEGKGNSEIISVRTELGKIIFKCGENKYHKCDVDKYLDYLDRKKGIKLGKEKKDEKNENLIEDASEKLLREKIRTISDIIRTNQLVLKTQEKYPENYYHVKSIINIGQSIEEEETDIYYDDIDEVIKSQIKDNKGEEDAAIKKLKDKFHIDINNEIKELKLKGEETPKHSYWLEDKGFNLISKIRFKNLIEINLARNGIKNCKYLDNMLLPHLEHLDLSYNKIVDIEPVANLKSGYLSVILLHHNEIVNLLPFNNFEDEQVDVLDTLRVDSNNFFEGSKEFKAVKQKFGNKLVYKNMDLSDFNKKYDVNVSQDEKKWDLSSKKDKNKKKEMLLLDLSNLITFQFNIQYLFLDDNKLENISILSRMPLNHLKLLDLSLNLITNIKILKKLSKKCKDLEKLYLNDNKILDITPLKEYSANSKNDANSEKKSGLIFDNLKVITLKNNPFYKTCHKNNNDNNNNDNNKDKKGNIEDRPNENKTEEEKGENINNNCIYIKDKETRKIFKVILTIANDFQKNIKVIEGLDEDKDEEKNKNEEEAKNLVDDSNINNTNNDDDIKTENNNSEN